MSEFIIMFCLVVLAAMIGCECGRSEIKQDAVSRGLAEYNATNAVWQWKEAK
jgi:hypothetical protein